MLYTCEERVKDEATLAPMWWFECLRCACVAPIALISGSAVPAAYRRTPYGDILVLVTVVS